MRCSLIFIELSFIRQINATSLTFHFPIYCMQTLVCIFIQQIQQTSERNREKKKRIGIQHVILQMVAQHVIVNCASNNSHQSDNIQRTAKIILFDLVFSVLLVCHKHSSDFRVKWKTNCFTHSKQREEKKER